MFPPEEDPTSIPKGSHWVDLVEKDTILVIDQPLEMKCACLGGIMAARMKVRGVRGAVVSGRVRDLAELRECGLPVSFLPIVVSIRGMSRSPHGGPKALVLPSRIDHSTRATRLCWAAGHGIDHNLSFIRAATVAN